MLGSLLDDVKAELDQSTPDLLVGVCSSGCDAWWDGEIGRRHLWRRGVACRACFRLNPRPLSLFRAHFLQAPEAPPGGPDSPEQIPSIQPLGRSVETSPEPFQPESRGLPHISFRLRESVRTGPFNRLSLHLSVFDGSSCHGFIGLTREVCRFRPVSGRLFCNRMTAVGGQG